MFIYKNSWFLVYHILLNRGDFCSLCIDFHARSCASTPLLEMLSLLFQLSAAVLSVPSRVCSKNFMSRDFRRICVTCAASFNAFMLRPCALSAVRRLR